MPEKGTEKKDASIGAFQKTGDVLDTIGSAFSKDGFIDKTVKIIKVAGLAALGLGGFALSKKLEMLDTVTSIKGFIDKIKSKKGPMSLFNPSVQAEVKEPIVIPEKSEVEKPQPKGDSQAKADKREAKVEKSTSSSPTKIALDTAQKMGDLSKRTQEIMSSYGIKSLGQSAKITNQPSSSQSVTQKITSEDIATSYKLNGGNLESLMAANNELLGIISEEIKLIHTNQVSKIVANRQRAQLMEILAQKDDQTAKKIEEENANIETLTEKLLIERAKSENKTAENMKNASTSGEGGPAGDSEGINLGKTLGTITKLALPFLFKKAIDILSEDSTKIKNENSTKDQQVTDQAREGKVKDAKTGETIKLSDNQVVDVTDDPNWANKVADYTNSDDYKIWDKERSFLNNLFGVGLRSGGLVAANVANWLFGNDVGKQTLTDAEGNTVHANVVDLPPGAKTCGDGRYYLPDKTAPIKGENGEVIGTGYKVFRFNGEETDEVYPGTPNSAPTHEGGPDDKRSSSSRPNRGTRSTKSNTKGVGKSISIDNNKNFTGFKGSNSSSSGGIDAGISFEEGGSTEWNSSDVVDTVPSLPEMDENAASQGLSAANEMKNLEAKIVYSQTGSRNPYAGDHTADCSATVQHVMKATTGIDPGFNTVAQITNKEGDWVDRSGIKLDGTGSGKVPDESKLRPGDLIFVRPSEKRQDKSRPYRVGHVEMYVGNGMMMGQTGEASGHKGPVYHKLDTPWIVKGYIGAKRFIKNKEATPVNSSAPSDKPGIGVLKPEVYDKQYGTQSNTQANPATKSYLPDFSNIITTTPKESTTIQSVPKVTVDPNKSKQQPTKQTAEGKGSSSTSAPVYNVSNGAPQTSNYYNNDSHDVHYHYGSDRNAELNQG